MQLALRLINLAIVFVGIGLCWLVAGWTRMAFSWLAVSILLAVASLIAEWRWRRRAP
jgi:hypothetical protein